MRSYLHFDCLRVFVALFSPTFSRSALEVGRRAAERLFFVSEVLAGALTELLAGFQEVYVSPWLRFLRYRTPGMPLAPHVDYQWLPGYVSAARPGYGPQVITTHSLLLYLSDCENGGL